MQDKTPAAPVPPISGHPCAPPMPFPPQKTRIGNERQPRLGISHVFRSQKSSSSHTRLITAKEAVPPFPPSIGLFEEPQYRQEISGIAHKEKHAPAQKRSKNGCQDEGRNQQQGRSFSIPHILMIPYPDFRILPESNSWINPPWSHIKQKNRSPQRERFQRYSDSELTHRAGSGRRRRRRYRRRVPCRPG